MSSLPPARLRTCRGKHMGAVRRGKIRGDRVGLSALGPNLIDDGLGFIGVAAVVDDNAGADSAQRERGGAAHAAGSAGDESNLVGEHRHGFGPDPGDARCIVFGHEDWLSTCPENQDFVCS